MSKIILVDGKLTKEKLEQILKRHTSRRRERKETKTTLADIWPGKIQDGHEEDGSPDKSQVP